jgi:protein-L-isoaspartate(D-aspartate) O-methyltransferase
MVGAMTEALQVEPEHRVLEIGTGSGYQAAVLAELCHTVYTVEFLAGLSRQARQALSRLGYRNVRLRAGNGQDGWPEFAPFDRVLVTAGAETMPRRLVEQLADGGRIVVPVVGVLTVGVKHGERLVQRALFGCVFVPFVDPDRRRGRS